MASKGKGIADGKNSSGKRKRQDDDNGGKSTKNRSVLQFFEDAAVEDGDGDSDSLSDDFFDDDFLADFNVDPKVKSEPGRFDQVPFWPKEEELSGDELEKMLEERYRRGSGYVRYAEDDYESKRSVDKSEFMPSVEPTIWKVKCKVGREKNTVFCLIQKFVDLKVLGTKLQIISAFAVEHIKGFVFVEAEKQSDVAAACNQLADVYFSLVTPVPSNEAGQLLVVKKRYHEVKEGTWARVKNGIYRGDLAQVVAVNNERKKATVKLVPRIDLQALTVKYGGGANLKRTKGTVPAARLISSSDLEEFRPLIQYRRDRDTGKMFEFLDSLMLKDGFLYKKVSIDSLSFWGVNPSEDELQKFTISSNDESDNVEWLSQLYGEPKKKPIVNYDKGGGKGGGKGEGSSGSLEQSSFEVHDLVHFGKRDFGMVVGMEKDENYKVLKDCLEGSVTLTLGQKDLKYVPQEKKFTALDHRMKTISINDTVRILEGPVKGRQGIVKQVYRGVIFLYDENDLDNAYFCSKSQMSEKVKHSACHGKDEGGPSSFEDVPSSPKSPLSPKKPWQRGNNSDVDQTEKDGMFSVGQSLRIRTGPLKGYLCRVLAIRYSDVTVKLDSKHKVLTVKRDHLSEVRGKSSLIRDDPETSSPFKPFDLLGTEGTTNDWLQPASGSADGDGWNVGGMSSERSAWPAFPSSGASIQAGTAATDLPSSVEDTAWLSKVAAGNEKAVDNSDQVGGWGTSSGGWEKAKAPVGDHEGSWNVGGCSSSQGKADNATNSWSSQIAEKSQPDPLDKGKCTEEQGGWNNIGSGSEPGTSGWGKPKTCTESVTWGEGTESSKQSIGNGGGVGWAEPKCSINPAEDSWGKAADGWGKNDTAAASSWGNSSVENDRVTSSWDKGKSWNDNKGDGSKGWNKSNEPDKDGGGWSLEKSSPQTGWKGVSSGSSGWGNSSQMSEEKAIDGWKKDATTTSGGWAQGGDVSQGNSWGKEYGGEGRESWSKPAGSGGRSGGRGLGGGSDQSGRGGGGRSGGGNCYKCGEPGHMARECPSGGSSGGGGSCYKCGELGHMARECPSGGGGGGGGNCYKCGESGHMARECPSGGSSGGGGKCYKCGESGHMARECPSGGSGGGGGKCYKCGESGHMARECPSGGSGGGGGNCYKCGESGHMARECPSGGGGGGGKCYKCGEPGHMARECPSGGGGGGGGKCYKCGEPGHMARECQSGGGGVSYGSSWGGGGSDKSSGDGTEKKGWSMGGGGGSSWGGSGGRYGSSWGGGSSDKPSGDVAEEKGWSTAGGGGSSWGNSGGRSESSWGGGSSEKPSGDGAKEKGWSTAGAGGSSWGNGGGRSGSSWGGGSSDKPSGDGVKEKGSSWGGGSCDGAQEKGSSWGGGSSEKPSEDGAPEKGWSMAGGGGSSWGSGSNNKKGGWD